MPACPPAPVDAPCARGHAVWGHARELGADPLALYEQVQRAHGDVARVRLLGGLFHVFVLASPDAIERVLSANPAWDAADLSQPVDLLEALNELTLRVASRIFFGLELASDGPAFGHALRQAFDCLGARLARGFGPPLWVPPWP